MALAYAQETTWLPLDVTEASSWARLSLESPQVRCELHVRHRSTTSVHLEDELKSSKS